MFKIKTPSPYLGFLTFCVLFGSSSFARVFLLNYIQLWLSPIDNRVDVLLTGGVLVSIQTTCLPTRTALMGIRPVQFPFIYSPHTSDMYMSWLQIQNRIQHVSTGVSCVLNSFLIFLILKYSPKKIGTYKFLMVYISCFQIFYSIMDVVSLPVYHTVGSVFVVFKDVRGKGYFNWTLHYILLVAYTGCYGFSMAIFGVHFYYRYLAICGKKFLSIFRGKKLIFWLLLPVVFDIIWAVTAAIAFSPTQLTDEAIEDSILESYDLELADIVYVAAYIWPKDPITGSSHLNLEALAGIGIMESIVISSLIAIFYFGSCCYTKICEHIKFAPSISRVTKNLHRQLFIALVMQTTIPIVLLHLPVSGLFMFPMIDMDLGFLTGFVTITIALYPAVDPLPTMFVIENYRNAILRFIKHLFCQKNEPVASASNVPNSVVN